MLKLITTKLARISERNYTMKTKILPVSDEIQIIVSVEAGKK